MSISSHNTFDDIITTIPPIIHHFSKYSKTPSQWLASYSSTIGLNTKFTFKTWNDEQLRQFIKDEYPWFLPDYDSYQYQIQRIDVARYFILRKYGGIYMDMDIGCRLNMTAFITTKYGALLPKTKPFGISNDLMMSTPSHPFFIYVTENLHHYKDFNIFLSKFITVMATTGSIRLSLMFFKYKTIVFKEQLNNVLYSNSSSSNDIMLFNNIIDIGLIKPADYESKYFYHLPGNSWQGLDGRVMIVIWSYKYTIITIIGLVLFCKQAHKHGAKEKASDDVHSHDDNV